jgi:hypothetical protein
VPNKALIIHSGTQEAAHIHAARILEFFGVPWTVLQADELADGIGSLKDVAIIGSIEAVAAALPTRAQGDRWPAALFAFSGEDRVRSQAALQRISGVSDVALRHCTAGDCQIHILREMGDVAGPMAGLEFTARIGKGVCALTGNGQHSSRIARIITVEGDAVFARLAIGPTVMFFSTSAEIANIDDPVGPRYYDIKNHLLSAAPLVMFVKSMFRETAWREQELGACLIVDDPLLKPRYGRCDFKVLRKSMQQHGFTTNISFIPWNWRRTPKAAAQLFSETDGFSVSIHGCDHTKSEFGDTASSSLLDKAKLAICRMESHEARTGIHHDRVMIFPQGVFSSVCPEVLKRTGYTAAVNTETIPVDVAGESTQIRDVWDVAITRYGGFPIFTRRYAHHGIENFAFDLLLGKPCLIVSHHEFFKENCQAVVELIEKLQKLNCVLQWRSLGEVLRRACRIRRDDTGGLEIGMYGSELMFLNPMNEEVGVRIRKRECRTDAVARVRCTRSITKSDCVNGEIVVSRRLEPREELKVEFQYKDAVPVEMTRRPLSFEVTVALRRILSEVRDEYLA